MRNNDGQLSLPAVMSSSNSPTMKMRLRAPPVQRDLTDGRGWNLVAEDLNFFHRLSSCVLSVCPFAVVYLYLLSWCGKRCTHRYVKKVEG